ncbi:MAG TPA: hypothetical protein VN541_07020 [Tepidisphaeraceae bacterium]|nr:hypothetical protein [Tepidisphaeraceae bacterium]
MNYLSGWQNFYVIVGSSGGALIGLQFVVIALMAGTRMRTNDESIGAFGTPNVVHFGGALAISAIMTAPWPTLSAIAVAIGLFGLGGLIYSMIVLRRARRQTLYRPVFEDWLWFVILPFIVYAALVVAAIFLRISTQTALFVIGGAALGLLFIGIHNAWDTVTYVVANRSEATTEATESTENTEAENRT